MERGQKDVTKEKTRPLEEAIEDIKKRRGYFSEAILKGPIHEVHSGYELLDEFRVPQAKVRS